MLISLILPAYNVENYIERCLKSCLQQDLNVNEYEIIVVNDGSSDNTLKIAKQIAENEKCISIISQQNKGLSDARNKGLSVAKGRYIWFIDSDDWIESNCLKEVTSICLTKDLDVLAVCASECDDSHSEVLFMLKEYQENITNGISLLKRKYFEQCVPFYILKREFLLTNNLTFFPGIFHEDFEFTPRMLYVAKRFQSLDKPLYNVYKNPKSITRTVNPKKAFDFIKVAVNLDRFQDKIACDDIKKIFAYWISMALNNSLNNSYWMDENTKKLLSETFKENRYLFVHLLRSSVIKYKLEGILFTLFPSHTVNIYRFLKSFSK